jgi:hypothetical protein
MSYRISCLVLATLLLSTGNAHASLVSPDGLNPGAQYRIAFVTSGVRTATSTNIADYNAFVATEANLSGSLVAVLSTTWTAIASTATVDARDNTSTNPSSTTYPTNIPIYLVDSSTIIANNYADLWDGSIGAPLDLTQFGGVRNSQVWTGSTFVGQVLSTHALGDGSPNRGVSTVEHTWWSQFEWTGATTQLPLYAISDVLTAVAVPEPSAFLFVGLVGLSVLAAGNIAVYRRDRTRCHRS